MTQTEERSIFTSEKIKVFAWLTEDQDLVFIITPKLKEQFRMILEEPNVVSEFD